MMNKIAVSFLAIMLILAGAFIVADTGVLNPVIADESAESTRGSIVSVTGTGELSLAPDVAYISIGVDTENENAALAQNENADKMTSVYDALKKLGIQEENIETSGYSIYQSYDYNSKNEDGDYDLVYKVSNDVKVTILDISKIGEVIDSTAKAGANSIRGISFGLLDESKYYNEALELAMQSAKGKATAIMQTFSQEPSIPFSVTEISYGGVSTYDYTGDVMLEKSMYSDSYQTPISASDVSVSATVKVEYAY